MKKWKKVTDTNSLLVPHDKDFDSQSTIDDELSIGSSTTISSTPTLPPDEPVTKSGTLVIPSVVLAPKNTHPNPFNSSNPPQTHIPNQEHQRNSLTKMVDPYDDFNDEETDYDSLVTSVQSRRSTSHQITPHKSSELDSDDEALSRVSNKTSKLEDHLTDVEMVDVEETEESLNMAAQPVGSPMKTPQTSDGMSVGAS